MKLAIILALATSSLARLTCPTVECDGDGLFPEGPCASTFCQCSHGLDHLMTCPEGLVFDSEAGVCNYDWATTACLPETWSGQCVVDFPWPWRVLSEKMYNGVFSLGDRLANTPAGCRDTCRANDFSYAGVRGGQCFCGDEAKWLSSFLAVEAGECRTSCPGDGEQTCGGLMKLNVFPSGLDHPAA